MIGLQHQQEHIDYAKVLNTRDRPDERTEIEAGISSSRGRRDPIPPPTLIDDEDDFGLGLIDDLSILAISPLPSLTPLATSSIRHRDSQSYPPVADNESPVRVVGLESAASSAGLESAASSAGLESAASSAGLESTAGLPFSDMLSPRPFNNYLPSTGIESLSPKSAAPSLTASFMTASFTSQSSSGDNFLLSLEDTASTPFFSVDKHTSDATNELASDFVLDDIPAFSVWKRGTSDEYIHPRASANSCSAGTQLDSFSKDASPNKRSDVNCTLFEADVHPAKSHNRLESLKSMKQEPLSVSSEEVIRDAASLGLKPVRQEPLSSLCVDIQRQKSSVPHDLSRADSPVAKRAKKRSKKSVRKWSEEEDNRLKEAVELFKLPHWTLISKHVKTRNCKMCAQRWRHVLRPEMRLVKKGKWSKDEDDRLREIVSNTKMMNERAWDKVSEEMGFTRSSIQCRERWKNSLDPTLRLGDWTREEDEMLLSLHDNLGPKWKKNAK